jgi:hypothetical protein
LNALRPAGCDSVEVKYEFTLNGYNGLVIASDFAFLVVFDKDMEDLTINLKNNPDSICDNLCDLVDYDDSDYYVKWDFTLGFIA